MPVHDWTKVDAGVFHDFHHAWIEEIKRALNNGVLPEDFYALAEQRAAGFGPDVLTLQTNEDEEGPSPASAKNGGVTLARPQVQLTCETDLEFYRRKQNAISIRHVSGDRIVAMVEVVSPGNKHSRSALRAFVEKALDLLNQGIHLLILDVQPLSARDPQGIHAAIWEELTDQSYTLPRDKPFTLASYETALSVRAYVVHMGLGERLSDMPLFLKPGGCVNVVEATYQCAWEAFPRRWRSVVMEGTE